MLIIAVLFAALIGPHFVDWAAYRGTFEREASAYVGRPVAIAGKAHLRLLPTPVVSFTDIRVGDSAAPDVQVERFRAEIELAPLLRGEVRVIQMSVERPRFRVDLASLAQTEAGDAGRWRIDGDRISLARLELIDGTAEIVDGRSRRSWQAKDIDGLVEAGSLLGPAKIEGDLVLDGREFSVSASLGRYEEGSVAAAATVETPDLPVDLALDGVLAIAQGAPPRFAGTATIAGPEAESDVEASSPWAGFRATGSVELTPAALALEAAQISYGAMERPLVLEASGLLDLGAEPRFDLSIRARQIDLDRMLGGGAEDPAAVEDGAAAFLEELPQLPRTPIPGRLRLATQGVVLGGGVIEEVSVALATTPDGWDVEELRATFPGNTELNLRGVLRTDGELAFQGHGRLASAQPPVLSAWWRGAIGSAAGLESFSIEGDLDLAAARLRISDIAAGFGGGTTRGSVGLTRFEHTDELFVEVDLAADRADLTDARALVELLIGEPLSAGEIDRMGLRLRADALSVAGIEARAVEIDGELRGGRLNGEPPQLDLRRLFVGDLAGTNLEADLSIRDPFGAPSGGLSATLKAADISGAAAFLAGLFPESQVAAHLRDAAPLISPVEAQIAGQAAAGDGPLSIDLTGSFADTHLSVRGAGEGSLRDPESLTGSLRLEIEGADAAKVLAQLGVQALPLDTGPLRLDAQFEGAVAQAGRLNVRGAIAGVEVGYRAETARRDRGLYLSGDLSAESENVDPVLLLAGFAAPGLGEGHAAAARGRLQYGDGVLDLSLDEASFDGRPVTGSLEAKLGAPLRLSGSLDLQHLSLPMLFGFGTGIAPGMELGGWSDAAFAPAVPSWLALDLSLAAQTLDLGIGPAATDAALRFGLAGGALSLDLASAGFAGGTLKGAIAATLADGEADLELRGSLQGGELQRLVWERRNAPVVSGALEAAFDLTGSGRSMAGLVSTLAGSGSFSVAHGRINGLNPGALGAVMEIAAGEEPPDEDLARETFAIRFGSGALAFERAEGSASVAGGVVDLSTVSIAAGSTTVLADAAIDLNNMTLRSQWTLRAASPEDAEEGQPSVTIRFSGPISRPERRVELAPLLAALQNSFVQRQLAEIEELEEARREAEARRLRFERQFPAPAAEEPPPPAAAAPPPAPAAPPPAAAAPARTPSGEAAPAPVPRAPGAPLDLLRPQDAAAPLARPELLAPL